MPTIGTVVTVTLIAGPVSEVMPSARGAKASVIVPGAVGAVTSNLKVPVPPGATLGCCNPAGRSPENQPGDCNAPEPLAVGVVPSRTGFAPKLVQVAVPVFFTVTVMPMTWPGRACARSAVAVCDTNE